MGAVQRSTWDETGLLPWGRYAPIYKVTGNGTGRVWCSTYSPDWAVTDLDDRWVLDETTMARPEDDMPRPGDVVIWLGVTLLRPNYPTVLWTPSLILDVQDLSKKELRVTSMRDGWLSEIDITEVRDQRPDLRSLMDRVEAGTPVAVGPELLDLWGINVWCPDCGHVGMPIEVGLGLPPRPSRDSLGVIQPWPRGVSYEVGCTRPEDDAMFRCGRCDASWGTPPIAPDPWWPPMDFSTLIKSDEDLVAALGCETVDDLKNFVDDHLDLDLNVFDVGNGVDGEVNWTASFQVTYPTTVDGFWRVVEDAEWLARAYIEVGDLAEQILAVEGFTISFEVVTHPRELSEEDKGHPEIPEYPFKRRAPATWTSDEWLDRRIRPLLEGLAFEVYPRIIDQGFDEVDGDLDDLRDMQRDGQLRGGAYR